MQVISSRLKKLSTPTITESKCLLGPIECILRVHIELNDLYSRIVSGQPFSPYHVSKCTMYFRKSCSVHKIVICITNNRHTCMSALHFIIKRFKGKKRKAQHYEARLGIEPGPPTFKSMTSTVGPRRNLQIGGLSR